MPSIVPNFEYDIFISYRHNDNRSGWVTEFVKALQEELAATIKDPISVYFDTNPHDGLLETHNVDKSLEGKLKCLIFIPIISQTYCDTKSFAWQHEFCAFNKLAKEDQFGRDIKLSSGNVASRILPIKIHNLDAEDKTLLESELGGVLRAVEFIYKEPGVNRPLKPTDSKSDNQNKTNYRNQVNKVANAVKELIVSIQYPDRVVKSSALNLTKESSRKSIAVLPFVNMSNDPEQEYFSDGLSEELLHLLAKIQGLKVVARTSSFSFRNKDDDIQSIGKKLNVQFILEGSVRKYGNAIRVTTSLTNAEDGIHLWSTTYDRQLENILILQEEIAQNLVRELNIPLIADWAHSNILNNEAYMLTMRGNYFLAQFNEGSFQKALNNFTDAIKLDPGYAPAFSGKAMACLELGGWHSTSSMEYINEAIKHATHAIQLNERLADAYIVLGRISFYQFDWSNADMNFRKAIELKPGTAFRIWYCNFLTAMGRFEESILFGLETIKLDPLSGIAYAETGWAFFHSRNDKDALTYYNRALELNSHYPIGLLSMGWLMAEMGKQEDAISFTDKAFQIISHIPTLSALAGINYAKAGLKTKALGILDQLEGLEKGQYLSPFSLATLLFAIGENGKAFHELHRAYEQHDILLVWLKTFRLFDHVRNDPQFIELFNKMEFPN